MQNIEKYFLIKKLRTLFLLVWILMTLNYVAIYVTNIILYESAPIMQELSIESKRLEDERQDLYVQYAMAKSYTALQKKAKEMGFDTPEQILYISANLNE